MRKRPATPPPPGDSLFFTVVNPYPEQPQLTTQGSKTFARWIASIVGHGDLHAFYHKPKSPRMVIIEVSKDGFTDLRQLLGEHRWLEILKTPASDHTREVSRIFPCTMTTPRLLEKERWQPIDVEASWLYNWSPQEDSDIVHPYPLPRFCQPPPEDVMRNPLCRPLREGLFDESAETMRATQPSPAVRPVTYRSPLVCDPFHFDNDFDLDYDSSPAEDPLPTPFVPGIHGVDNDGVTVVLHSGSDADTEGETLWAGYGETDAPPPKDLCSVHGIMCSSGICRQCGLRKREELKGARVQKRLEERDAWGSQREARRERRGRHDWGARERRSSSPGGSGGEGRGAERGRDDSSSWKTKGKFARGAFSASATSTKLAPPLPPHLRKGAAKVPVIEAAPPPPPPELATPTATSSPAAPTSPPSDGSVDGDGRPDIKASSSSVTIPGMPSALVTTKAKDRQPSATIPARQEDVLSASSSVAGPTADAFKNPWKGVQPEQRAPKRWADMVDEDEAEDEDEDEQDEDEQDEDEQDEDGDGDDSDYLPRGVTVTEDPGAMCGEDGADSESVFSGWDEDVEPF